MNHAYSDYSYLPTDLGNILNDNVNTSIIGLAEKTHFLFRICNSAEKLRIIKTKKEEKYYQNRLTSSGRAYALKFDKI